MANAFILFGLLIAAVFVVARLIRRAMRGKLTAETVITFNPAEEKLAALSKEVTQLKKTDPKAAVEAQIKLIQFAKKKRIGVLSHELRLAYLLHFCGQKDEAFGYLNRLSIEGSQLEKISSSPQSKDYWSFRWQVEAQRGKLLKTEKKWNYWLWSLMEEDENRTRWALCVRAEKHCDLPTWQQAWECVLIDALKNYESAFKKLSIEEHFPDFASLRERLHREHSKQILEPLQVAANKVLAKK